MHGYLSFIKIDNNPNLQFSNILKSDLTEFLYDFEDISYVLYFIWHWYEERNRGKLLLSCSNFNFLSINCLEKKQHDIAMRMK